MKFFISGPMTGHPDLNAQAFADMRALLEERGHTSVDAVQMLSPTLKDKKWTPEISRDVLFDMIGTIMFDGIEGLVLLDGWLDSPGARAEQAVAEAIGLPIYNKELEVI